MGESRLPALSRSSYQSEYAFQSASQKRIRQETFLEAYSRSGDMTESAKLADVTLSAHHRWMSEDPSYRAAFRLADVQATDVLKSVYWSKTLKGDSDHLAMFFLKHHRPDVYGDKIKIDSLDKDGVFEVIERLMLKAGRVVTPEILDAQFSVAQPHGGEGRIEAGGPPLEGVAPPSLQKDTDATGPIPESSSGTPEGPISESSKES